MAPLRSLLVLLIFAGLLCAATAVAQAPVEWYGDTSSGGGGAVAGAVSDSGGGPGPGSNRGGALAPTYLAPINSAPADPNLPPPTEMPADDSPPAQVARARAARAHAAGDATTRGDRNADGEAEGDAASGADRGASAGGGTASGEDGLRLDAQPASSSWDPLPFKGLELAALGLAGLCLLVGGAALRPRPARR